MFFGGNNYGRITGNSMATAYAQDAPVCSDGLLHEPHFSHLARLHRALALQACDILGSEAQLRHGVRLEWHDAVADAWKADDADLTAFEYNATGFLEHAGKDSARTVRWRGAEYELAPRSILLVDAASHEVLYDSSAASEVKAERRVIEPAPGAAALRWETWSEPLAPADTHALPTVMRAAPAEQTAVTAGLTEYLWYETNVSLAVAEQLVLRVTASTSLSLVAWLNGTLATKQPAEDHNHDTSLATVEHEMDLTAAADACDDRSSCLLTLLSIGIGGTPNYPIDPNATRILRGIVGDISLGGANITTHASAWRMRPGLAGEHGHAASGGRVPWAPAGQRVSWPPGTWLRTRFATPSPLPPAAACLLNLTGMGRGHAFVNGHDIGRFWLLPRNDGSGLPSQRFYHVPPDWLAEPSALNELVLFEDEGARDVSLVGVAVSRMAPQPVLLLSGRERSRALLQLHAERKVTPCEF
jgi:hypothetical protein